LEPWIYTFHVAGITDVYHMPGLLVDMVSC
jgi:hypothetical protein